MSISGEELPKFGRWRNALWPVHRFELKKLIPMLLIFFLVSFDYNVLRILKDTLVVTAKSSGAEVIPFIKVSWRYFDDLSIYSLFKPTEAGNSVLRHDGDFFRLFLVICCCFVSDT